MTLNIDYVKLQKLKTEKNTGRVINKYRCLHYNQVFMNHKNAPLHCASCKKKHNPEPRPSSDEQTLLGDFFQLPAHPAAPPSALPSTPPEFPYSDRMKILLVLIAEENIPYTQVKKAAWSDFITSIDPSFSIPPPDEIRVAMLQYSKYVSEESLQDMSGTRCGLAVDGASYRDIHYYSMVLVSPTRIRLLSIEKVDKQDTETLGETLAGAFQKCRQRNIMITGVCSDNTATIVATLDNNNPLSLGAKIGSLILRLSCAAHTSQLSIGDFLDFNRDVKAEIDKILALSRWCMDRCNEMLEYTKIQLPSFCQTRWNTIYKVLSTILRVQDKLNEFITLQEEAEADEYQARIARARKPEKIPVPVRPPVGQIPSYWSELAYALKVISDFTFGVEGDLVFQQDMWRAYQRAEEQFAALADAGNECARALCSFFRQRFVDTVSVDIAHLAYLFTPEGLKECRETADFESDSHLATMSSLKQVLCQIAAGYYSNPEISRYCFRGLFDYYIESMEFDVGEDLYAFWKQASVLEVQRPGLMNGNPVPMRHFARVAQVLVTLPCTEAVCERAFSKMKSVVTKLNGRMTTEMFMTICTVKLSSYYRRKYE